MACWHGKEPPRRDDFCMPGILVNSILLVVNRGSTHWREQSLLTDHHARTTGIKTGLPAQLNQIFFALKKEISDRMYGGRCLVAPCDSFRHGRSKWQREVEHLGRNLLRSWHLESYAGPCRKPVRACIQARTGWSDEGQRDNCLQQWGQAEQPCGVSWPLGHLVQLWFTASAYPSFGCWWQDSRLLEFCIEAHREEMIKTYKASAFFLSAFSLRYEMHDKIIITRQIVIGGRNRYLLNSHNVQQNQIQNLLLGYHYDCQTNTRAREWAFDVSWHDMSTCLGWGFIRCRWMWTIPISWSCRAGSPRSSTWSRRKLWVWLKRQQARACMRTRKPWPSRPWKRSKTRQCKWEMGKERWDWVQTGEDLSCASLGHPRLGFMKVLVCIGVPTLLESREGCFIISPQHYAGSWGGWD